MQPVEFKQGYDFPHLWDHCNNLVMGWVFSITKLLLALLGVLEYHHGCN